MKKKPGRKEGSGVHSGIKPERETWEDIRNRIRYDSAEWPLMKVRHLIGDGSVLPDDYLRHLSAELAKYDAIAAAHVRERKAIFRKHRTAKARLRHLRDMHHKQPVLPPILSAWKALQARFDRAVLDGDAGWFERQATALRSKQQQEHILFNAKIVYLLEHAWWGRHASRGEKRRLLGDDWIMEGVEDATLTPAGKFTDAFASHVWKAVVDAALEDPKTRSLIEQKFAALDAAAESYGVHKGCNEKLARALRKDERQIIEQVVAEIYGYKTKDKAQDEIRKMAERIRFGLKKQPRQKRKGN